MLTQHDYRHARDTYARQFAQGEIDTLSPVYAKLERDMKALLKAYQVADKHTKTALDSKVNELGFQWQDVSARLNAAWATLERLGVKGE